VKSGKLIQEPNGSIDLEKNKVALDKSVKLMMARAKKATEKVKKEIIGKAKADEKRCKEVKRDIKAVCKKDTIPVVVESKPESEPSILDLPGAQGPSYNEARAKHMSIKAQLAQLELDKAKKALVSTQEVYKAQFDIARKVRDAILSIPDRLSNVLASEMDAFTIRELLDTELRKALEGLKI
jgi:hypothetical protein